MRKSGGRDAEGRTLSWTIAPANKLSTLEDLKQALRVYELSPDQRNLSIYLLCPHPALVRDIVRGWTPERDEELNLLARKSKTESVVPEPAVKKALEHYLYFPRKTQAKKAAKRLEAKGWQVEVRLGADAENWLVLAKQSAPISEGIEEVRDELERIAAELHGEYDGWGAGV